MRTTHQQLDLRAAKDRLNAAAARLLAGDHDAACEAELAMAEVNACLGRRVIESNQNHSNGEPR